MQTIAINGTSGFLGTAIGNFLKSKYNIITVKRSDYNLPPENLALLLEGSDYVINLAGAPIAQLWTNKSRQLIYSSRIDITKNLVASFKFLKKKPKLFVSVSGINIYESGSIHSESSLNFSCDFLGKVCKDWESEAIRAKELSIPVAIIRTGIVLSPNGGFLEMISKTVPFKFLIKFGKGSNSFPFIHLNDYLNALLFILEGNYSGIFNFVAPNIIDYSSFYKSFSSQFKIWLVLTVPGFILKWILKDQAGLFIESPAVIPEHLTKVGYRFYYMDIKSIINSIVEKN
jgi:uncharacterized protein (TIGR01777 family)